MNRNRRIATWAVFLATFAWLLTGEVKGGAGSLWPSLVAVGLAFIARDIYIALFLGAFAGAILLRDGNVAGAFLDLFSRYLLPALADPWNSSVLVFTLMMGGFVEVLNRGGGMAAMAALVMGESGSKRRAAVGCYAVGWMVFFDGLANAMLVGKTMRPLTDRVKLSREKLAFIVDSTSSPIAGLAVISTWVAYEMSQIKEGFAQIGDPALLSGVAPYQLLLQSLPYRFYNWFMLLLVFLIAWLGRDAGPMLAAERKAREQSDPEPVEKVNGAGKPLFAALVPLVVLVMGVFGGLFVDGGGLARPVSLDSVIQALGQANAALVFVWATAFASLVAMGLSAWLCDALRKEGPVRPFFEGMKQMFLPASILVLAWMLNGVIKEIGTANFLVSWLGPSLWPAALPGMVFVLSAFVSFSTGTSWGTMAIVMPLVIPLAARLSGLEPAGGGGVMVATIGAVLAGAVFGDHCSPISDTTIVSAFSSDCDPLAHVRTQLPYAMMAGLLALVVGYLPVGVGVSPYLLLGAGGLGCWALVRHGFRPAA